MSALVQNNDKGLTPITSTVHLASLLLSLDQLIYVQIAALYYQDNSFLNLILRWIAMTHFVPPNAAALHRIPVVLLLNAACVLQHLLGHSPTPATDGSRGYMDGSVLIDFVGEFAHTSKLKLVAQDVFLLVLHLLLMVVGNVQQKTTQESKEEPAQDLDAEEQGVRRAHEETRPTANGEVESHALLPGDDAPADDDDLPPVIKLDMVDEIRDIVQKNAELYNRLRSSNDEALRTVLQAVAASRARQQQQQQEGSQAAT